uniref:Uncharacterized protein LOC100180450 n=1 Tax=Phallusia mammillata TaxID=59560 RepID=A0A6F9DGJ1_9ASCI|nr:uncharacterized protein LOC100180450 [Phallusia mammillata]
MWIWVSFLWQNCCCNIS